MSCAIYPQQILPMNKDKRHQACQEVYTTSAARCLLSRRPKWSSNIGRTSSRITPHLTHRIAIHLTSLHLFLKSLSWNLFSSSVSLTTTSRRMKIHTTGAKMNIEGTGATLVHRPLSPSECHLLWVRDMVHPLDSLHHPCDPQ